MAPGRRHRPGMDARRDEDHVCVFATDVRAERDAEILDRAREGRHRGTAAVAARVSGKDLTGWPPYRVPHEHVMGRGAAQLSRWTESTGVDRRSQVVRSGLAAMD